VNWQQLLNQITPFLTNQLSMYILGALGLSGGIWLFLIKFGIKKVIIPAVKKEAAFLDEKKIEDTNLKEYKDAVQKGDLDEIAKRGADLLND
jgi:hypothetical protein